MCLLHHLRNSSLLFINSIVHTSLTFKNKQFCGHIFLIHKIFSSNIFNCLGYVNFYKNSKGTITNLFKSWVSLHNFLWITMFITSTVIALGGAFVESFITGREWQLGTRGGISFVVPCDGFDMIRFMIFSFFILTPIKTSHTLLFSVDATIFCGIRYTHIHTQCMRLRVD